MSIRVMLVMLLVPVGGCLNWGVVEPESDGDVDADADVEPDGDADADQDEEPDSDADTYLDADLDVDSDEDGGGDADADLDADFEADTEPDGGATCGDRTCEGGESARSCPEDCPAACGDGLCTHTEDAISCADDCSAFCGDAHCTHDEDAALCPGDCRAECGDTFCTHEENADSCPDDCLADCGDGFCTHEETNATCPDDCECDDGVRNGDETDEDCGGDSCPPCAAGLGCFGGGDCVSGVCVDGVCQRPAWVTVRAGTFTMGSPASEPDRWDDERLHEVILTADFEIQATEVTQIQFGAVMGYNPSWFSEDGDGATCGDDCPVEMVNWHEAAAYCNELSDAVGHAQCYDCSGIDEVVECEPSGLYLSPYDCPGYRLPTEAEFEFAARAGTRTATYNGDLDVRDCVASAVLDPIAWHCGNSGFDATPLTPHTSGTREPNAWGLYDMLGNINEWCHDWYGEYLAGPLTDPFGPGESRARVYRGGSWDDDPIHTRAATRFTNDPGQRYHYLGFRPVRTLGM